jgi:metal-responsive CopG/Arc/MetJ family transcriptional regulator
MSSARRPGAVVRRVNVDFPEWMVAELDREAEHLGVTRQSVIKVFIAERLKAARSA